MSTMFRQKALIKLRSPEQLDEPLRLMRRHTRVAWATFLVVIVIALFWGIAGRLPEDGRGQGILVTPNTVQPIQAHADGQIGRWAVKVGDQVKKGDLLVVLYQPAMERELILATAKLKEVEARNETLQKLREKVTAFTQEAITKKRQTLKERILKVEKHLVRLKELAEETRNKNVAVLDLEKKNLIATRKEMEGVSKELKKRSESYERLLKQKLTSDEIARNARSRYEESVLKLAEIEVQVKELEVKSAQAAQSELEAQELITTEQNTLTQLSLQQSELKNREALLEKQDRETIFREKNEVVELRQNIDRVEQRLKKSREIRSEHAGRILEVSVAEGIVVTNGQRLAQIDTRTEGDTLIALAYFKDEIGKQLKEGDAVRVAPSPFSQKRYGSMKGRVIKVTPYPVTADSVANTVGSTEVAQRLTLGGFQIEVRVELLKPDLSKGDEPTPSGYAWTSQRGPEVTHIQSGTYAEIFVTPEHRAPISFILPVVRKWGGL